MLDFSRAQLRVTQSERPAEGNAAAGGTEDTGRDRPRTQLPGPDAGTAQVPCFPKARKQPRQGAHVGRRAFAFREQTLGAHQGTGEGRSNTMSEQLAPP